MIRRKNREEALVPRRYWADFWPVSPTSALSEMDRLFDSFRKEFEESFGITGDWLAEGVRQPVVDLVDTEKEYVVRAELPGISKEDLSIEVADNVVEIKAERKEEAEQKEKGYLRKERHYSKFVRRLPLPEEVAADQADAELKDGVLTLKLPKVAPPERPSKKVKIR